MRERSDEDEATIFSVTGNGDCVFLRKMDSLIDLVKKMNSLSCMSLSAMLMDCPVMLAFFVVAIFICFPQR